VQISCIGVILTVIDRRVGSISIIFSKSQLFDIHMSSKTAIVVEQWALLPLC